MIIAESDIDEAVLALDARHKNNGSWVDGVPAVFERIHAYNQNYGEFEFMTVAETLVGRKALQRYAECVRNGSGKYRCYHCGESFGDEDAELHFGKSQTQQPACQIDVEKYREMEELVRRYRNEDSDLERQIHSMIAEIESTRRRAEDEGYARGLADAQKNPAELGLTRVNPV